MKIFLTIFSLIFFLITNLTSPLSIKAQTTKESPKQMPERAIQEYIKRNNLLDIKTDSSKYQTLMKDILLGEHPDLMTLVGNKELIDYALKQLKLTPDSDSSKIIIPQTKNQPLEKNKSANAKNNISYIEPLAISYNRGAAAQYAKNWAENGQKIRNSNYPNFPNDCTNFVSQAVYTGGIPQYGTGSCNAENNYDEWYVKRAGWNCFTSVGSWAWSYPWAIAYPFRYYTTNKGYASGWLYPRTQDGINQLIYDAYEGDMIQLRANGTTYHSMMVTSWYWNNWNDSDLYMTYHTGPRGYDVEGKSIRQIINNLPAGEELIFVSF